MKGHRSRGKARQIKVAGYGRYQRRGGSVAGPRRAARLAACAADPHPGPSLQRTAKEKQLARAKRAVKNKTLHTRLGRAIRRLLGLPT